MPQERERALLDALARAPRPLTGGELGSLLQVSSRSIRTWVRQANRNEELVAVSRLGYQLTPAGRQRVEHARSTPAGFDTPQRRLQYLCRVLAQTAEHTSIFDLAERLFVSESTIEGDLRRVREVLAANDLVLRRDHEMVWVEGPERSRRQVVRQVLLQTGGEVAPQWDVLAAEFSDVDVAGLRRMVVETVADSDVEMNEYALGDIVLHLVVTVDRIHAGHVIPEFDHVAPRRNPSVELLCRRLLVHLAADFDAALPESEFQSLYAAVAVRVVRAGESGDDELASPATRRLVAEAMDQVVNHYLLGPPDEDMLRKLSVHVENVIARARAGIALSHPLGEGFRQGHPLVHEMAISFAERLEAGLGIEVAPSEIDYLALHMGMQYMTYLDGRDLPTVTAVLPRYHGMEQAFTARLEEALRGRAVVERTVGMLDEGLSRVSSDLVVACAPVPETSSTVVIVSPLLGQQDIDRVVAAAQAEHERIARRRLTTTLHTMVDPALFHHVESVGSKREALSLMCDRLQANGYVGPGFLEDCMDRERRSSTAFGGPFAIPHSMRMDASSTAISVLVSDHGIPWGMSSVRLVMLFALAPDGRRAFRDGLDEITRILAEPGAVDELVGVTDAEGFLAVLDGLLDR